MVAECEAINGLGSEWRMKGGFDGNGQDFMTAKALRQIYRATMRARFGAQTVLVSCAASVLTTGQVGRANGY